MLTVFFLQSEIHKIINLNKIIKHRSLLIQSTKETTEFKEKKVIKNLSRYMISFTECILTSIHDYIIQCYKMLRREVL